MKRRFFLSTTGRGAVGLFTLTHALTHAQASQPRPGIDFKTLERAAPVDVPAGKIELLEFFWYNCPHCNAFEPALAQWVKTLPSDVVFKRVPVAFRSSFVPQQQLFYALEAMGLIDTLHARVFAAIHRDRIKLNHAPEMTAWIAKQGVDPATFTEYFNAFSTIAKARRATQLMTAYSVEGVPALGVAGRFYTDGELTRNMDRALQVTAFLLDEVRAGR